MTLVPQMPMLFKWTTIWLFIGAAIIGALIIPIRRMIRESSLGTH